MSFKRVSDVTTSRMCQDPGHEPPTAGTLPPGVYVWTCPRCGNNARVTVPAKT